MRKFKNYIVVFMIIMILIPNLSFGYYWGDSEYVWSENTVETSSENGENSEDFLDLSCESAILIEQTTGTVLYEKNAHTQLRPASVTKIMTILLIMEAIENGVINYDTEITCSENAASMGGSQIWLEAGESLSVDDMLKAICVVSRK